jgi:hypothetical protein
MNLSFQLWAGNLAVGGFEATIPGGEKCMDICRKSNESDLPDEVRQSRPCWLRVSEPPPFGDEECMVSFVQAVNLSCQNVRISRRRVMNLSYPRESPEVPAWEPKSRRGTPWKAQ